MKNIAASSFLLVAFFFMAFAVSCKKVSSSPATNPNGSGGNVDSTGKPSGNGDSIYVITDLTSFDGESIQFTYDYTQNRYTCISGNGGGYDSSLISYNQDGTIFSIIEKTFGNAPQVNVTVITYNNLKQISKIYTKETAVVGLFDYAQASSTDISDSSSPISFCDSVIYDSKNRVSATYRIAYNTYTYYVTANSQVYYYKPGGIVSNRKFYYQSSNDSLLSKVEDYSVDSNNNSTFVDSSLYLTYDNKINPFYKVCPIDGLITSITRFYSQASSGLNSYTRDAYLHFSPQNCTNSYEDGNVVYSYNDAGLPVHCYYPNIYQMDYTTFKYVKVKKQ